MKKTVIFLLALWAIVLATYARSTQQQRLHGKAPTPICFDDNQCSSSSSSSGGAE